jgi:hypothetical protein
VIAVAKMEWTWVIAACITAGLSSVLFERFHFNYWIGFFAFWGWVLVGRLVIYRYFLMKRER